MLHQSAQHADVHGFADEVEGAGLQCLHRQFDVAESGDHGDRGIGVVAGDFADQFDAIAIGQAHVGEAQVVGVAGKQLPGLAQVGSGIDTQAHAAQRERQQLADVALVVDDQGTAVFAHSIPSLSPM